MSQSLVQLVSSRSAPDSRRIARVFPRRTKATPDDALAFYGLPDKFFLNGFEGVDEVHVSNTFTADKIRAEQLAEAWSRVAPTTLGGVVTERETNIPYPNTFTPGMYIKTGFTFTSRGCPRRCWFCGVWKLRPQATPILNYPDGWNVLDDNLLSCPEPHVRSVFKMLEKQGRRICFTGGLEAKALEDYQVGLLADMKPRPNCFFAYDPGDPFETLKSAADRLMAAGFTARSHRLSAYVLIGYPKDTFELAEARMHQMLSVGFTPYAMLWQPETPSAERWKPGPEWKHFQRVWARPRIIYAKEYAA